jgi:hypothetical protein
MKAQRNKLVQQVSNDYLSNKWLWLFVIALLLAYISFLQYELSPSSTSQPRPFSLPTFDDKNRDFHVVELGAPPEVKLDFDTVFSKIEQCFPIRSYFSDKTDLKLSDNLSSPVTPNANIAVTHNSDNSLYNIPFEGGSSERRLIILEAEMRLKIIDLVSQFFQALEQVRYNDRALNFYQSLEQRAKERVQRGIVGVDEQVLYLEKVIKTEHDLNEWRVKFNSSRLSLTAFCKDDQRVQLNQFLSQYVN